MQQRGFAKTRSATAALPLQSRFSECTSEWQASCLSDLLFNISGLLMCCSWRTIFSAVHKKYLPNQGVVLIMKPASGRGMQCVRFGVVSSILLLLGETWRNQHGLRFFFARRMSGCRQSSILSSIWRFSARLWQKRPLSRPVSALSFALLHNGLTVGRALH
ncbi:hypothetical protein [Aquitalea pelogenes]|uniref:hypothetical protein n=1 Tax=Aquitalea pelogenes TaxID=1293573 RepID=UPI0035AE38B0